MDYSILLKSRREKTERALEIIPPLVNAMFLSSEKGLEMPNTNIGIPQKPFENEDTGEIRSIIKEIITTQLSEDYWVAMEEYQTRMLFLVQNEKNIKNLSFTNEFDQRFFDRLKAKSSDKH